MMTLMEAIDARHSVRAYRAIPIDQDTRAQLDSFVKECNEESGLDITIMYDDPDGFDSRFAHYGNFRNVNNYIVLKGSKSRLFTYKCGYYGEKIVLRAQQLGLNTCWTAMTFNKKRVKKLVSAGEKLCMVIALGYGESGGTPHRGKSIYDVISVKGGMPEWFVAGVEAALKAPTAMNQQKFCFSLSDSGEPAVTIKGAGPYTYTDLGIVAYHFELGAGRKAELKNV